MSYGEWDVVFGKEVGRVIVVMEVFVDCWVLFGSGEVSVSFLLRDFLVWFYCWVIFVVVLFIGIVQCSRI